MPDRIDQRARFDFIRYANCWEDAAILVAALQPAPGRRVLSIASAGDNALALLASGAEVVAADLNHAQLACLELRVAAIRALDDAGVLSFLGLTPAADRAATYTALRPQLTATAQAFWDAHPAALAGGIIHAGRFEQYFTRFRRFILPLIHGRGTVQRLLAERPAAEREDFYAHTWDTWRWRALFRLFFSRRVMGRLGRDPEFFRYVEGDVAGRILARTRAALTLLPTHDNPYLTYILTGNFLPALPYYLRPTVLPAVRAHLDRLTLVHGGIEVAATFHRGPGFDAFNLSDIFEYLAPDHCRLVHDDLLDCARPGARLAYWNMLAPRHLAADHPGRAVPRPDLADPLFARDQAFFYRAFIVEEVS